MKTRSPLGILIAVLMLGLLVWLPASSGAVVSGANGRIAFVSNRDGDNEIYSMRADGTGVQQLTDNTANDYDPNFSGDGTKIAFISDRDGTTELYLMDASGANPFRVTTNTMTESHPYWAPNDSAVTFAGLTGTDSDIYTIRPTGTLLIDLTPDTVAFDENPSWSPGGKTIAFDRTDDTGTNVWTMSNTGTDLKKLTTTGKDSHANWSPDNKTLAFDSARDVFVPGPSYFASVQKPVGVAVTGDRVLVTQWATDKVKSINDSGVVSNFANLPRTGLSVERYIAVSPGLGGFQAGYVYVTVGANIYQITPNGSTVTLFCTITTPNNGETSISFDTVGTYNFNMILTDRSGPVWTCDSAGVSTQVGDFQRQVEGPLVAPLSFVPYAGRLVAGSEFGNGMYVLNQGGNGSTLVGTWTGAEGVVEIPNTACNLGSSGGAYFVAMKDDINPQGGTGQILKFGAQGFAGLGEDLLLASELDPVNIGIGRFSSDGSVVTSSTFWAPVGQKADLEGSAFAPCPSGRAAQTGVSANEVGGPHEIYTINTVSLVQTRLTNNSTDDEYPAWSPDGKTIIFQADRDDPNLPTCEDSGTCLYEAYKMNATDGSGQANISNSLSTNETNVDWEAVAFIQTAKDFEFTPLTAKPKIGGTVLWDFTGPSQHTVTDNSGMGLFDSGLVDAGDFFIFRFIGAGSYAIHCTIHANMTGTVKVPMTAAPKTGNLTTRFTITWTTMLPNKYGADYNFDIQVLRPGAADWADWRTNMKLQASAGFSADSGTGVYSFRARLQNGTGAASDYSAPVSITINP